MDDELVFGEADSVEVKHIDIINTNYFLEVEKTDTMYEVSLRHKVHPGRFGLFGVPNSRTWDELMFHIECEENDIKQSMDEFEFRFFNPDVSDAIHNVRVAAKEKANK